MALEPPSKNEAFLSGGETATEDDLAALDSMAFTGTQNSQFGMNTVAMTNSSGGASGGGGSSFGSGSQHSGAGGMGGGVGMGDGRDNGFSGVSGSLFDRIRARTAEQQKQSLASQSSQLSQQQQEPAQSSQQSAFMSQQQQQPSSGEPTMEIENKQAGMGNAFDSAVSGAGTGAPTSGQNNDVTHNETTYSFAASAGGEDFSQPALRVPQYGASRDDPYYAAANSGQQPVPTTIQDKAAVALAQTGETVKSLFSAGLSGAQAIGAMAQDKMAGGGGAGGGQGRNYNNNFLLREDSLETGHAPPQMVGIGSDSMGAPPPPPVSAAVASGSAEAGAGASDQAYSMLKYGKTFCEDLAGFVMQLPPWGKGLVAVVLLWVLYAVFGGYKA